MKKPVEKTEDKKQSSVEEIKNSAEKKMAQRYFFAGSATIMVVLVTFGIGAILIFTQLVKTYLREQRLERVTNFVQTIISREIKVISNHPEEESFQDLIDHTVGDIKSFSGIEKVVVLDGQASVLWSSGIEKIGTSYEPGHVARAVGSGSFIESLDEEDEEEDAHEERPADIGSYDSEIYVAVPISSGEVIVLNIYFVDTAVFKEVAEIRFWLIVMTILGSCSIGSVLIGFYSRQNYLLAEREKLLSEIALAQTEKYKAVTDSSPDCIKLFDTNGKLSFISRGGIEEHSLKDEDIDSFDPLTTIVPKDQPKFKKGFEKALLGNMTTVVIRHTKKGSNREACEERIFPIRGADGTVVGVYAVSRDISDKLKKERQILELADLRNKFIRIVSHQLRTPLNSVRWNMETLLAGDLGPMKSEQKEFLRVSHDAEVRVINRINDLITIMDIEEGRITLKKEIVSLPAIWNSVLSEFAGRAKAKEIGISVDTASVAVPDISADTDKVRTVFIQLLRNAIDYTKERGSITVIWKLSQAAVRFEISDTGIGIPESDQKNIFKKFSRGSNASTMLPDASGIGLAIAHVYIGRHGGKIGFESKEQKGSTFWFELPLSE